jgi:hypothetical protein
MERLPQALHQRSTGAAGQEPAKFEESADGTGYTMSLHAVPGGNLRTAGISVRSLRPPVNSRLRAAALRSRQCRSGRLAVLWRLPGLVHFQPVGDRGERTGGDPARPAAEWRRGDPRDAVRGSGGGDGGRDRGGARLPREVDGGGSGGHFSFQVLAVPRPAE